MAGVRLLRPPRLCALSSAGITCAASGPTVPHAATDPRPSPCPVKEQQALLRQGRLPPTPVRSCGPAGSTRPASTAVWRLRSAGCCRRPRPLSPRPAHEQQHAIFMARTTYVLYVLNQGRRRFIYDFAIRYLFPAV